MIRRYILAGIPYKVMAACAVCLPVLWYALIGEQLAPAAQPIFHGSSQAPRVALACNVFWGEEYLDTMLEVLAAQKISISFFIGGSWAKRNPETLLRIAESGHELGNHSYSHPHPKALNREQNQQEIQAAADIIYRITGHQTKLYAPPYGEYDEQALTAAADLGYKNILWSIDTIDWRRPPATVIIERVTKKLHNGAIILMHPTQPTVEALPELLQRIQAAGYEVVTVSALLP